jgi:uncharacterized protein YqfA (UPF0365 family)
VRFITHPVVASLLVSAGILLVMADLYAGGAGAAGASGLGLIVRPLISATKAGLDLDVNQMEAHYLAGGSVGRVVTALISADRANIELPWKRATAIDLAGRDVLEAAQVSVNLKVIQTPRVSGVAQDGIQVIAIARVTIRANIKRLVGGAGEETIIARVGEGTVSSIGSALTRKQVLERGLDAGTAYESLSIDIADVDVGRNIGAELQTDQAEADKKIAQAKAEERRAMAVATEQEMRARVVEAEAQVPLALAEALRKGRLGVVDNCRMENVQADTSMRRALAQVDGAV